MTAADEILFQFEAVAEIESAKYDIDVPCGSFALAAAINDIELTQTIAPKSYRNGFGAEVTVWPNDLGRLELFRSSVTGQLYEGAKVDGCEAAIWRFRALSDGITPRFQCAWTSLPDKADGGPDSGQNLDALTWHIGSLCVSLGTEDSECLQEWARQGKLPARWEQLIGPNTVQYQREGLRVALPALDAGEICEVTFLVAWNTPTDDEDASTWVSVGTGAQFILERAGCQ